MFDYTTIYTKYANQTLDWLPMDTEERYILHKSTKFNELNSYGWIDNKFTYKFNSNGFRCDEFTSEPTIMFLGCSLTVGIGLPLENCWASIVAKQLSMKCANLGVGGGSADTAFRLCHGYIDKIKPKILVLLVPPYGRKEMFTENGNCKQYGTWTKNLSSVLDGWFMNDNNLYFQAQKNILGIKQMCVERNIKFVHDDFINCPTLDFARDLLHPGIKSNLNRASIFLEKI